MDNKVRELLANCLREASDGYVVNTLVAEYPSMQDLMNASEDEIRLIKGIGAVKAKQLKAILKFVRTVHAPAMNKRIVIHSPKDVFDFARTDMEYLQVEKFAVIGLSTKNHVVFKADISSGSLNSSIVHPRETFRPLIKRAYAGCILVHNHPSGDPSPSQEDITITTRLVEAGKLIDIQVLDHVIIGQGSYFSFKAGGLI